MEYLMTYGWAILIIIIVVAVLFSLGVFNPSTYTQTTATGLSGFRVPAGGWQLSSGGTLTMQVENGVGATIDIQGTGVRIGSTAGSINHTWGSEVRLGPGQTVTLNLTGLGSRTSGTAYSADINITYENVDTGLPGFISTGTLTGTVT